ncbi:MAG: T9SS type A sorting domain-containing protein [Flavobacteriales bacterium]|nr:T9SS type A sorting domain-containing protein [Flavobacteriales bacterium]
MRTFYTLITTLFLVHSVQGQMLFTGGPLNTSGQCWSIWASGDSALMGYNEGLYRTINGGDTWEHLTNGIPADVDPRTIEYESDKLIVGTNDGARIYQSDDFGDSFTGGTGVITSIAIPTASTSGPGSIIIGGTLFQPYTFDFGTNDWISTGGSGFVTTHGVRHLGGDTIWINRGGVTSGTTSYSHDNGLSWTDIITEPETDIGGGIILSSVAQDFLKVGNRILVGTNLTGFPVLFTDDYGTTWQASNLPSTTWSDYGKRFIKVNDSHLLTVNLEGVWKSTDQGETWTLIQSISQIRTMAIFNGDNLLVGTDNGVCEFDNYGEGDLITKHGVPSTPSNLIVEPSGIILAGTKSGISQYNPGTASWSNFQDTTSTGLPLSVDFLSYVEDTIYAMNTSTYFKSGDGGTTFTLGSPLGGQIPTVVEILDGKKFIATQNAASFQAPKIFYSADGGTTYTEASFTNPISLGYGGSSGNIIEHLIETPEALIADMQAGYAISTDGGLNWTFTGGVWDVSFLAVDGTTIYHYRSTALPIPERLIEVSSDNGTTWSEVSQDGLPASGGSNYMGIWGIWNLNGKMATYNSFESTRGIYQLNGESAMWELVPNSAASIENTDGITHIYSFDEEVYANWQANGTWKLGEVLDNPDFHLSDRGSAYIYPNPAQNQVALHSEKEITTVSIFDASGKQLFQINDFKNSTIDVSKLKKGFYTIHYRGSDHSGTIKFLKI